MLVQAGRDECLLGYRLLLLLWLLLIHVFSYQHTGKVRLFRCLRRTHIDEIGLWSLILDLIRSECRSGRVLRICLLLRVLPNLLTRYLQLVNRWILQKVSCRPLTLRPKQLFRSDSRRRRPISLRKLVRWAEDGSCRSVKSVDLGGVLVEVYYLRGIRLGLVCLDL